MVVDMQNDSGSQGGMFDRAGVGIAQIRAAIAPTRRTVEAARQAGIPIVYLKMAFRPDLSDLGPDHGTTHQRHLLRGVGEPVLAPDGTSSRVLVLVRDTWNTDIVDELVPVPVESTLRDAIFRDFRCLLLEDLHSRTHG